MLSAVHLVTWYHHVCFWSECQALLDAVVPVAAEEADVIARAGVSSTQEQSWSDDGHVGRGWPHERSSSTVRVGVQRVSKG